MAMTEKIRIALIKRNMTVSQLAEKLGCSSQNLSAKFRRDNFSEKDLQDIAKALDCTLEMNFIDEKTGKPLS